MKTFLIIGCLIFSLSTIGQKHSISINYKPSLTFLGKQKQSFEYPYFKSRKGNKTFNNSANLLYKYKITSKINVSTGLEFSQQGQNINLQTNSDIPEDNKNIIFWSQLNYFRIPLTFGYSIFLKNKSELDFYTGLSFGIATKREDNYQDVKFEDILLPPANKRYQEQDWAIPVGINYQKSLTKNINAIFGIEYMVGLKNSFYDNGFSKFGVLSEFDNSRQKRLSINIGIGFNL